MLRSGRSLLFVVVLSALLAACGDEAETPAASPTASPDTTSSAAASQRPDLGPGTLVFLRGDSGPEPPQAGAIWVSDFSGENARQVTPQELIASYLGLSHSKSGQNLLYYATQDSGTTTVRSVDLDTGVTTTLLSYPDLPQYYSASVSPDGRYLVHTSPTSLDMHDFATGSDVTLFQSGSGPECTAGILSQCYLALDPIWSPDGRLLKVVHRVYEGGWAEVADPFTLPVTVFTTGDRLYPHDGAWSPGSDALCAQGIGLAAASGLYLLEHDDWEARNLIPEFEDEATNPGARQVVDCDWSGPTTIAYLVTVEIPSREGELYTFDRVTGETRRVVKLATDSCCTGNVEALPDAPAIIAQILGSKGNLSEWSQPQLVELETRVATPILQEGDVVLDSFAR